MYSNPWKYIFFQICLGAFIKGVFPMKLLHALMLAGGSKPAFQNSSSECQHRRPTLGKTSKSIPLSLN